MKVVLLVSIFLSLECSAVDVSKIIHGETANATASSFYAFILVPVRPDSNLTARCSGTIVTMDRVLTACHCVAAFNSKGEPMLRNLTNFRVMAGSTELKSSRMQERNVSQAFIHALCHENKTHLTGDGRRQTSLEYDLAMIILESPFNKTPTLQPAKFLEPKTKQKYNSFTTSIERQGVSCWMAGWGTTRVVTNPSGLPEFVDESPVLKNTTVKMLPTSMCKKIYCQAMPEQYTCKNLNYDDVLCGIKASKNAGSECLGDAGGGLVCDDYVLGVISYGFSCDYNLPVFFGKLSLFIEQLFEDNPTEPPPWKYTGKLSDLSDLPYVPTEYTPLPEIHFTDESTDYYTDWNGTYEPHTPSKKATSNALNAQYSSSLKTALLLIHLRYVPQ